MRTLKINLLYNCTAQCEHCRFGCRNDAQPVMPDYETAFSVASTLQKNRGLDLAVLLGGEPTLFVEETLHLIERLHAQGIATRLETNGQWADTPEHACALATRLKATNTQVMLSLDGFHDPFVPFERVANAVRACVELGIDYNLEMPYLDQKNKTHPIDQRTSQLFERLQSMIDSPIPKYEGGVLFIGRAAQRFGDQFAQGRGIPQGPCTQAPWWFDSEFETDHLLILEPGGYLTKGCGIAMGNVHKQSVIEILEQFDARKHPIFSVLLREGPLGLARMAEAYGYKLKSDYAEQCHLCHEARQVLQAHFDEYLQPLQHYTID